MTTIPPKFSTARDVDISAFTEDSTPTSSDYIAKHDGSAGKISRNDFLRAGLDTVADGATVTFDLSQPEKLYTVTLGGNRTLAVSNTAVGDRFAVRLLQDGTGSRTVTWWSTITWPGGSAPTLTTTASKADWFEFVCTAADTYECILQTQNVG